MLSRIAHRLGSAMTVKLLLLLLTISLTNRSALAGIESYLSSAVDQSDPFKAVEGTITGGGSGKQLHTRYWRPTRTPRAVVVLIHGLAEHLQWYDELGRRFATEGILAFGHDHVGHGLSDGERVNVGSVDEYVDDVFTHVDAMKVVYPSLKRFAVGHSMGGMILLGSVLKRPQEFSGVVLMGPLILFSPSQRFAEQPIILTGLTLLSWVLPSMKISTLDVNSVTRDDDMRRKIKADPIRAENVVKARWYIATITMLKQINRNLNTIVLPFLILLGEKDQLCDPEGSKTMYALAASPDKELKVVPDAYHDLYIEYLNVRNTAMGDTVTWVVKRI